MMDVHELANLLQTLNFRVVSLLNTTKEEMTAAIQEYVKLLDKGVYGEKKKEIHFYKTTLCTVA